LAIAGMTIIARSTTAIKARGRQRCKLPQGKLTACSEVIVGMLKCLMLKTEPFGKFDERALVELIDHGVSNWKVYFRSSITSFAVITTEVFQLNLCDCYRIKFIKRNKFLGRFLNFWKVV
jgi:hypothetical protein